MKKGTFFKIFASIVLTCSFVTIYQHNQIIKLMYEKRRLEMKKELLTKATIDLNVQLCRLHDYTHTQSIACYQLGMAPLKLSQVITMTQTVRELDCYTASTQDMHQFITHLHRIQKV